MKGTSIISCQQSGTGLLQSGTPLHAKILFAESLCPTEPIAVSGTSISGYRLAFDESIA